MNVEPWIGRVSRVGRRSRVWARALVCVGLGSLTGACAWGQSLMQVYQQAQAQDAPFAAARKVLEAALEKLPQARAGLLPSLNLSATDNRQWGEASFSYEPFVERSLKSWSWTAQLTQPLLRWGNWQAYLQADAQVRQAKAQFVAAEHELMLRTAQAYFDVLFAQESWRVALAQEQAVQEQLVLAQRNFDVGTGTVTDVHEARARRAQSQAQRVAARNELENRQAELGRLTGQEPGNLTSMRLAEGLPMLPPDLLEGWLAQAAAQSPQIQIQQAALEVARKEVDKTQAQHLPTLDLVLNRQANFNSGSLSSPADVATRVHQQQVGVQLNVPLFSGGATQSRVREALALQDKAREDLHHAQRTVASQVRQSYSGVVSGQAQVAALQEAVAAGRQAVEANKIGFRIGTRINPDVLNAEQQLYATLRDLTRARIETLMQGLRLKAAAGSLQPEDLAALDRLIEPGPVVHDTQLAQTFPSTPQD